MAFTLLALLAVAGRALALALIGALALGPAYRVWGGRTAILAAGLAIHLALALAAVLILALPLALALTLAGALTLALALVWRFGLALAL